MRDDQDFSFPATNGINNCYPSLTKRELFALFAQHAMAFNPEGSRACEGMETEDEIELEARISVQMADALIAELERTE
jgi:hypothetical protein